MVRLTQRDDGRWVEDSPTCCPCGHPIGAGSVVVNFVHCDCTPGAMGHRTWTCRSGTGAGECGLVIVDETVGASAAIPPMVPAVALATDRHGR